MKNRVRIDKVLDYYDGPILFLGKDTVDTKYLCVRIERDNNKLEYISTTISNFKLSQFLEKEIDLRKVLETPNEGWFVLRMEEDEMFEIIPWEDDLPEEFLPKSGLYYYEDEHSETLREFDISFLISMHTREDILRYDMEHFLHASLSIKRHVGRSLKATQVYADVE